MSARGEDKDRNGHCHRASDRHLKQAIECGLDRTFTKLARDHEYQDGCKRRDAKTWVEGCRIGQRSDGECEDASNRHGRGMRHQGRDRTGVDRPANRSDDVVGGRLQRSPDAHLGHHNGRKDGPQSMQRNCEELRQGEGQDSADRHSQAEAQVGFGEQRRQIRYLGGQ